MNKKLKLMCVLAHPDDESLGTGGILAKYADEGVETFVVCATMGERGRFGSAEESPGLEIVGNARESELLDAAKILAVKEIHFLDYIDADLDQANPKEIISKIVLHIRKIKPDVVVTFGPDGGYGHPDHIAISQFTTGAIVSAADSEFKIETEDNTELKPFSVSKLYYLAWTNKQWDGYQKAFKKLVSKVDGVERQAIRWPDWEITTEVDARDYSDQVWRAVCCHKTQMTIYDKLAELSEDDHRNLWGCQQFYRAFSKVNGGRKKETSLFEGII